MSELFWVTGVLGVFLALPLWALVRSGRARQKAEQLARAVEEASFQAWVLKRDLKALRAELEEARR